MGEKSTELADAKAHIFNKIFGLLKSISVRCAAELGIPEIIHRHGQPMTLHQLVAALPIHKHKALYVQRLLHILVHSGYLQKVKISLNSDGKKDGYWLTPLGCLLLANHPLSSTPFMLSFLSPILVDPWEYLTTWLENDDDGSTPYDMAHGRARWNSGEHAAFDRQFKEAMASDARLVAGVLVGESREVFQGLESIVDVGGSTGELAKVIARAFPEMKCTVLDLPHVVRGLEGSRNLDYVAGNMFEFIPPATAVLMKWILHCWSDWESVEILKKCKEAIGSGKEKGGKVMIIEMVVGKSSSSNEDQRAYETELFFDMEDMVLVPGRERTEKEWSKLFFDAGFTSYKVFPILGLRCLIEVYP